MDIQLKSPHLGPLNCKPDLLDIAGSDPNLLDDCSNRGDIRGIQLNLSDLQKEWAPRSLEFREASIGDACLRGTGTAAV